MPEEEKKENMVDVGEADQEATEINLDEQAKENEKKETEVEQVEETPVETEETKDEKEDKRTYEYQKDHGTDKSYENERESKLDDGEKKDELKEYSEGVQKRIAKLTRKMREAERQKEEAIAFAQVTKKERDELQGRFSKLDKSYVDEFENRVKTNMDAARQALKTAIEASDVDGQVKAQEQIATLTADAARLSSLKAIKEEEPKQEKEVNVTPQRTQSVQTDPKAEQWASKNAWFGNDSAMTYTAFDLHKQLVEVEGYDPKSDEYYEEIDKRIRVEFPQKFDRLDDSAERARPAQTVASARRPSGTGRRKTVKLTPSQVAIAKRLGVPLEEYAKQLNAKEGA